MAIDLDLADISLPLAQFQAQRGDREGIYKIVEAVNSANDLPLAKDALERSFAKWWPDLDQELTNIRSSDTNTANPKPRSDRDLLEELLGLTRSFARSSSLQLSNARTISADQVMAQVYEILHRTFDFQSRVQYGRQLYLVKLDTLAKSERDRLYELSESIGVPIVVELTDEKYLSAHTHHIDLIPLEDAPPSERDLV
ncbi:hypothetical protein GCM10027569_56220 [Flindersiella endophytica]